MLRAAAAGALGGALVVLGTVGAQEERPSVGDGVGATALEAKHQPTRRVAAQRAPAVEEARRGVAAHRKRLAEEIADLVAIRDAQAALARYVELGGGSDEESLDRRLCRESALRALCPSLEETFGEFDE